MKKYLILIIFLNTTSELISQVFEEKLLQSYNGFFNFYYEEAEDKIYLEVDNLDSEFLYVNSLSTGIGSNDIGFDRGQLGKERIVKFIKTGNKLLLIQKNTKYRAISENTKESQWVQQAFASAVLWSFPIVDSSKGWVLVDASDFILQDSHGVIRR